MGQRITWTVPLPVLFGYQKSPCRGVDAVRAISCSSGFNQNPTNLEGRQEGLAGSSRRWKLGFSPLCPWNQVAQSLMLPSVLRKAGRYEYVRMCSRRCRTLLVFVSRREPHRGNLSLGHDARQYFWFLCDRLLRHADRPRWPLIGRHHGAAISDDRSLRRLHDLFLLQSANVHARAGR
jgi:hypothetical protein